MIIPSTSQPAFGSYFVLDIKERNILIHNLALQFNCSAITGRTGDATYYPHFSPAYFWWTRIEVVINGQVMTTHYNSEQFIMNQLFQEDEDRIFVNNCAGNYASIQQRNTMSTTAGSSYICTLKTLFDQIHYPLLADAHSVQLRVYTDSLTNIVAVSGGTGTAVATINYVNLIAKISRLDINTSSQQLALMNRSPQHNIFHDLRYGTFNVASGVSSTTVVLTPIVGKVAALFFTIRPTASLTGDSAYQYTAISNFSILDSTSTNCVGGQPITSQVALQYLAQAWFRSSYTTETSTGSNLAGTVVNNSANVYCWSFSSDPVSAITYGRALSSRQFIGNEQLQLTFTSALAANVQVDVYALTESILEQGSGYVKKISL
jgi:hypothetical protein